MTCGCGHIHQPDEFWLRYGERVVTCHACGKTSGVPHEGLRNAAPNVIDDTLPGGARWIQNLDHTPVWVETKTQYRQELASRGLEIKDTGTHNKNDRSPWATRTRLR